jgi:hypothetical protein
MGARAQARLERVVAWQERFKITEAGREYLDRVDGPEPPAPRQANVSVTQQLVDDVIAGSGLAARSAEELVRARRRRLREARAPGERHGKVPPGKRLTTRGQNCPPR